jgi:hypothetical protein
LLTIKEITVKNFMSVGNQAQAIDFSNKSSGVSDRGEHGPRR